MMFRRVSFAVFVALAAAGARADVQLPAIFGDNMVLQAGQPVPVWGKAEPGEEVEVRVSATKAKPGQDPAAAEALVQTQRAKADAGGDWKVTLAPLKATTEPVGFVVTGKNKRSFENVIVGDVWICSGQSNMEWEMTKVDNAADEIAKAKFPTIRLFEVAHQLAPEKPADDVRGHWVECSPENVDDFTAVGYFFGRTLQEQTGQPVGLIQTAWGGTPCEAWTSYDKLASEPTLKPILDRWEELDRKAADGSAKKPARGEVLGPKHHHHPATLFNGMVEPLIPYAVKGAIWYQGEGNAGRAYQYRTLFPAMITDWRGRWGQGDFPFLFVQLANFMERKSEPGDSAWAELREAQHLTLQLPETGEAVIIDIGEAGDIHPKNKQDVGKRLALAAMKVAYDRDDVVYSGPTFKTAEFQDGKAILRFEHVDGLRADGGELKGFSIAGADQVFKWAKAEIDGESIVVSSADVPQPVAVRYAWADNPEATLYNAAGLPASPFRTDDWPGITVKSE